MEDLKICVVGAGVVGLSVALYLAQICKTKHSAQIGTISLLTENHKFPEPEVVDFILLSMATF